MNYSYLGLFLAVLITVTFFAPLFIERGYRKVSKSKEEFRQEILKQMANKAFTLYAVGVVLYIAGLAACLPEVLLGTSSFPSIARFEDHGLQTFVVIFNTFTLDNRGFIIYYFVFCPLCLIVATVGMWRFEKSREMMRMVEQIMKEKS